MPDRMGLILLVENLDQYEAAVKSVKSANDQVAGSMQSLETGSKKVKVGTVAASVGIKKFAGMLALANVAAGAIVGTITRVVGSFKQLLVSATMLTARYRVLIAALRTTAAQAGLNVEATEELVQAIHEKGVTYHAATELVLSLIDAEADLDKALGLVTTAQNAASRAGGSTSETIQRMLWAMQTAQPYLLRSVYLTVDFAAAEDELARSLNTTAEALTEGQQMQARMNAIIKAGKPLLGTYAAAMDEGAKVAGSLRDRIKDILTVVGKITYPAWSALIVAAYKRAKILLKYLEDNKETLENMGEALAEGVKTAIVQVDKLIERLGKIPGAINATAVALAALIIGLEAAEKQNTRLGEIAAQAWTLISAGVAFTKSAIGSLIEELVKAGVVVEHFGAVMYAAFSLDPELIEQAVTGFKTAVAEMDWGLKDLAETASKAFEETFITVGELTGALEKVPEAADEAADGLGDLADDAAQVTDEMKDLAEALTELRLDLQRELVDDLIDEERRLLQQEINLARQREDIARRTAASIAQAYADAAASRANAAAEAVEERAEFERDAARDWADLEEDAARDREKIDLTYADRRIDIEVATRRRLEDIQRQFEMSLLDAARTRDAFALVQAQRRAAADRGAALRGRDEQLTDAKTAHGRQIRDFQIALAEQREDLRHSLAEQKADLEDSLRERQQDIERQLQEQLLAIEEANQREAEDRARSLAREREDEALQARWEQEDRTRRLTRQLEDMERQYGDLGDITAEGLQQQVKEWADTYGPSGAATRLSTEFTELVETQIEFIMEAQIAAQEAVKQAAREAQQELAALAADIKDFQKLTRMEIELGYMAPPELQLHSPKLGLQLGLEKLQEQLRQPMSFMAGGPPATSSGMSRTETYNRSESKHDVNLQVPGNLDLVVQRQLVGLLSQTFKGAS